MNGTLTDTILGESESRSMYLSIPLHEPDATQGQFLSSLTGSNSEFSFSYTGCLTKVKELCLFYYFYA